MDFRELREFIDNALRRLSDSDFDGDRPRSKEELDTLFEMLNSHLDALEAAAPEPAGPRPTSEVPYASSWFEPSEELDLARERRDELLELLEEVRFDPSKRVYVRHFESELNPLEQEIAERESRERQEHEKRRHEYLKVREQYDLDLRMWEERARRRREWQEKVAFRARIVERVRKDIERKFGSGPERIGTLPWELAAPGERADEHVRDYFREVLGRGKLDEFDQDRLDKILALPWSNWSRGIAGFYGYIVLWFDHTEKVVMECPVRNNAIYVLDSGEKRLLQMNKQQLIGSSEAKRIFHSGDPYRRVKQELGITTSAEPSVKLSISPAPSLRSRAV